MINIRTIRKLSSGGGLTLKNGQPICYKSGWQVADHGIKTYSAEVTMHYVRVVFKGNCGIWFENGVYYIDHSFRVNTKRKALEIGRKYNQISVYGWKLGRLAYCQPTQ